MRGPASRIGNDGLGLAVSECGSGPTALFIHGWGASRLFWREVIARVSTRFHCVAPDLPGFGDSDKPDAPYTVGWFAEWLRRFAERCGAETVMAHSMGATVAARWAVDRPAGLRTLVLVNPPVVGAEALRLSTRLLLLPGLRRLSFEGCRTRWFRRWVARDFAFRQAIPDDLLDALLRPTYAAAIRSIESLRATDLRGRLERIAARTLVIGTDRDRLIRPAQFRVAAERIPGARLAWIGSCGHVPMVERPEEFLRVVEEFLGPSGPPAT